MINNIKSIQGTVQVTSEWVNELMQTYPFQNEQVAFVLLVSTLKTLRDRILPSEAVHLGAQLPALIRGFYYEGWDNNSKVSQDKTVNDFLLTVAHHLKGYEYLNLGEAVPVALKLIFKRIDQGEAEEVINNLPKEIKQLCS